MILDILTKRLNLIGKPHYHTIIIKVLEIINKYSDGVYVGILDKNNLDWNTKKPKDVEYQFFKQILFEHILPKIDSKISIIFDKGRLNKKKKKIFDDYKSYYKNTLTPNQCIRSVDSTLTPQIWASDVIAGAFQHKYQKGESAYVNELKNIQVEKSVNIK